MRISDWSSDVCSSDLLLQTARQQGTWPDRANLGYTESCQCMNIRTRDATVQNVADNRHRQIGEILFVMPDRVHIEQALGRLRMATVTCVDDMYVLLTGIDQLLGNQIRFSPLLITHDKPVGMHPRHVSAGIQQRSA